MKNPSRRQFLKHVSIVTAGALIPAPLRAQTLQSRTATGTPVIPVQLDGGWQYRQGPLDGIWQVWRTEDNDLWGAVSLPHCFNALDACDPDVPYYRGQGWYRTRLPIKNPFPAGRTLLHFRGAGQTTTLWVGPTLIGTHKGGYDEFTFDITDAVAAPAPSSKPSAAQGVEIAVLCDNSPDLERVPSDLSDFCLYGGLYRHVSLVYVPALALDSVHIVPTVTPGQPAQVAIHVRLYNPAGDHPGSPPTPVTLKLEILDPAGRSIHTSTHTSAPWTGYSQLAQLGVDAPQLWSPDSPHLYRCRVTLTSPAGETALEERFGLRHLEWVDHGPFKLNGQRLLLNGTQRHADHAGYAAAQPDDLVRQEMQMIRDMGANFIRLAHYQQDRLVLELCDELGIMVWEEVPWCRSGVGDQAWQQNARAMLTDMIDQHFNHPSVILWGLGNEDDWPDEYPHIDKNAIRAFMTELRELSHSLDATRLTSFRRCDFAQDIPDIYSPSIWAGWYRGTYQEYEKTLLSYRDRVKHLVHAEWGADSHAGRHSENPYAPLLGIATNIGTDEHGLDYLKTGTVVRASKDGDSSETYACDLFDWYLKTQETLDWFAGSAQWVFKDFASPLRGDNPIPRVNQKGLVERDLTKKECYYVFQSYWSKTPMLHIYGNTWPIRWGTPGELRPVKIYSNCDHAELFLNGISLGTKQRNSRNFPAAGLRWDVPFQPGTNHLRAIGSKSGNTVTDEIELTYQTQPWGEPTQLRLVEASRSGNTVTFLASLHDANGVLCLDARNLVRFSVAGDATLIQNLGTVHGSRELQLSNGRAHASIIRSGPCTLAVASEDMSTAMLPIP